MLCIASSLISIDASMSRSTLMPLHARKEYNVFEWYGVESPGAPTCTERTRYRRERFLAKNCCIQDSMEARKRKVSQDKSEMQSTPRPMAKARYAQQGVIYKCKNQKALGKFASKGHHDAYAQKKIAWVYFDERSVPLCCCTCRWNGDAWLILRSTWKLQCLFFV